MPNPFEMEEAAHAGLSGDPRPTANRRALLDRDGVQTITAREVTIRRRISGEVEVWHPLDVRGERWVQVEVRK